MSATFTKVWVLKSEQYRAGGVLEGTNTFKSHSVLTPALFPLLLPSSNSSHF